MSTNNRTGGKRGSIATQTARQREREQDEKIKGSRDRANFFSFPYSLRIERIETERTVIRW